LTNYGSFNILKKTVFNTYGDNIMYDTNTMTSTPVKDVTADMALSTSIIPIPYLVRLGATP